MDLQDDFHAIGWLNALPDQRGIPGWQRITFMKHFAEDLEEVDSDNLWAYEGVVLPGGRIIVGRWWFASEVVNYNVSANLASHSSPYSRFPRMTTTDPSYFGPPSLTSSTRPATARRRRSSTTFSRTGVLEPCLMHIFVPCISIWSDDTGYIHILKNWRIKHGLCQPRFRRCWRRKCAHTIMQHLYLK